MESKLLMQETLASVLSATSQLTHVQDWMEQAFYPVLLLLLVVASLGLPIPEDIPLIAAGVLMRTNEGIARWEWLFLVALTGVMIGDLVLYMLGRWWGPSAVNHRFTRMVLTPERFARISARFQQYGAWFCFFGRFFMGVRAAMCVTAGATGFPYWRFFLADLAGATLSVPLFVFLGYWFAGMLDQLQHVLGDAKALSLVLVVVAGAVGYGVYRWRKKHRRQIAAARAAARGLASLTPPRAGAAQGSAPSGE